MKRTYANAQATGIVGADPVILNTPTATVATLSIGVGVSYVDPGVGRTCEKVEWHHLIAAGSMAEQVRLTVRKGCRIKVEGVLRSEIEYESLTRRPLLRTRLLVQSLDVLERPQPRQNEPSQPATRSPQISAPPPDELWDQTIEVDLDF